ncbi:2-oxoglutarate/2-oxoacid ferredoxin oxidoreductase, beta subunit [hydrothermal vent metagenome]|uniref:2-oxoglutarate/2-oxoacid ferredoxin oxidoreductase, beta subunit n=1 Tax=hydrothermal vent metagenome TaxID=652676 RepID=A0A3B1DXN5_9ZZZZ
MDNPLTIKDLNTENPRWCAGCGDFGIVMGVKRFMVDEQLDPTNTVNVSGIGCSGRAPFYFNTYGIHSIHGRAIPVAMGLALGRPDLNIFIHSGDGDALSIGGNHLIHGINKNFNCVFLMYDNEIYALTKNQTSPTTPKGHKTNTQPFGSYLEPIFPLKFALGAGVSFAASTADWMPDHLTNTLKAAFAHKGFSFIHVAQRCPHFYATNYDSKTTDWFSFLTHEDGIPADKRLKDKTEVLEHDPKNKDNAFHYAQDGKHYFGLFYRETNRPQYDEILHNQVKEAKSESRLAILDRFKI